MNRLLQFIKTTIIGGIIVLVPIAICGYLIGIAVELVYTVTTPILKWCGIDATWQIAVAPIVAGMLFVVLCFLLGLIVQTTVGRCLGGWVERLMLRHLPGYQFLKQISRQFAGMEGDSLGKPVLVRLGDYQQIGLLMEEHADGRMTVFVPLAPAMSLGSIVIVSAAQASPLTAPMNEALNVIGQLGFGTAKLVSQKSN